ncbi:MAG: LysM domain-containing protein [Kiritimatiellia bacterium]|nr:LysM peptidoglycan-binding domain-containing protein [Lentisphaerota bacterium]
MKAKLIILPMLLAWCGGCVTTDNPQARMHEREDFLIMRDSLTRLEGRMEGLEMEYRRLLNEIETLRRTLGEGGTQQRAVQDRLNTLEQRLTALDAARERDRQAIVDQLTGRITQVMQQGGGTRTGGGTGYEHVVQAGETLSAIATAYKVSARVIIEANDLKNPDHLRQGQKLFIPQ